MCLYLIDLDSDDENLLGYNHHTQSTDFGFRLDDYFEPRNFGR